MIQRKMARHHDGTNNKAPRRLLLWWSGTTVMTFMFVIVLRTHLAVVSRYQPNSTITIFSSSGSDMLETHDVVHSNNKNHSSRLVSTRGSSSMRIEATNKQQQRPTNNGRFSNTWNFTEQEQHVVAPMVSVFGSSSSHHYWDELHGKKCQQTTHDNLPALQDYISSLDLYIVSHGGLGSNAVIDHLDTHTSLKVKQQTHADSTDADPLLYYASCHLGNPAFVALVRSSLQQQNDDKATTTTTRRIIIPPTLIIVGDFWNAFQSMKRRKWLNMNIAKNLYGSQACRSKWENSLAIFPHDPAGIKMMMLAHVIAAQQQQQQQDDSSSSASASAPIVFLQAPYKRESILQALQLLLLPTATTTSTPDTAMNALDIERHLDGFEVRQRGTKYKTVADAKQQDSIGSSTVDPLLELYQPYEALEDIMTRIPRAWKASDTPQELLDYLLEEFQ